MELKDIIALVSFGGTVVMTYVGLRVQNVVATWRAEALEERNQDKDDLKDWIESRFLPSREADTRLRRLEEDHRVLSTKVEANEVRLRHIETFRGPTPHRSNPDTRQ